MTPGAVAVGFAVATWAAPLPAGARASASAPAYYEISGNFAGDSRDELFAYTAGSTPDVLVEFDNGGVSGGDLTFTTHNFTVNGTYRPIVGNFDGDSFDEILWYAPGTAPDYLWNFTSLSSATSKSYTINGTYRPVAGDFTGDGVDDILWYAPGTAPDYLWEINADGGHTSSPRTINGTYTAISGSFGSDATDDIFWYAAGTARDYLWDFHVGTTSYTSKPTAVNGTYHPFSLDIFGDGWGGNDIFWYAPGTAPDYVWDYIGGVHDSFPDPVNGTYRPVPGDYLGDGFDDILWSADNGFVLWDHDPEFNRWIYSYFPSTAAAGLTSAGSTKATEQRLTATDGGRLARG